MPTTFLEAKQEIVNYAKRDETDATWLAIAGNIINESIVKIQRIIPNLNALGKVSPGFTYTANSKSVAFTDPDVSTDVNKIISVQETTGESNWYGEPLRLYTYQELANEMQAYEERKVRQESELDNNTNDINTYSRYVENVFGRVAFVIGDSIGLFPTPTQDITLAIHYTPWLPPLSADDDTNVILKYCWEFVLYSSLVRLNLILSESERIDISAQLLNISLGEVRNWDKSLSYSNPIDL
jgi:hypothetical protein